MTPNINDKSVIKKSDMNLERIIMRPIQLFKTKFLVTFPCIYDVRVLKLSSSNSAPDSMSNDDVMTKTKQGPVV